MLLMVTGQSDTQTQPIGPPSWGRTGSSILRVEGQPGVCFLRLSHWEKQLRNQVIAAQWPILLV